jgi:hypothetical protein
MGMDNAARAKKGVSPGWNDSSIHPNVPWRDGDIVVSVPPKSGTTWTMNIVHQLREGGDRDFDDLYVEVPWLEFIPTPTSTQQDQLEYFASMTSERRRAFKTHCHADQLGFQQVGEGADVQYVVVMRHPDEATASMYYFIQRQGRDWLRWWGRDPDTYGFDDFETYFEEFAMQRAQPAYFDFLAAWWPRRDEPNVLLLHFSDLKADHEGSIRQIADFLGYEPAPSEWDTILECTSFPWMKKHSDKFELRHISRFPVLEPGAMVRKGKAGSAREDGMTPEMSKRIAAVALGLDIDRAALDWLYRDDFPADLTS